MIISGKIPYTLLINIHMACIKVYNNNNNPIINHMTSINKNSIKIINNFNTIIFDYND